MTWRRMIRPRLAPKHRAASTYSSCFTTSVCARTNRASCGENTIPTASMPLVSPMPSAPVTPIASTIAGNDRSASITRLIASSTQPPRNPASNPTGMPIRHAIATARKLAYSVAGAP